MRSIQKKKIFLIENGEGVENMVNIKKIKQNKKQIKNRIKWKQI